MQFKRIKNKLLTFAFQFIQNVIRVRPTWIEVWSHMKEVFDRSVLLGYERSHADWKMIKTQSKQNKQNWLTFKSKESVNKNRNGYILEETWVDILG